MKKLTLLTIIILTASLNAMEEQEQKGVPSLTKLCAKAFTNKKTVNYVQQHENAAEYYASFFENNLPYLEADIACSIIAKLPKDILDANAQELKDMLCGDLQKNTAQSVKIGPAVKAAIVKHIIIEPTIVYALLDSVFDSKNEHPDKNVLGCALFEQHKELQTWENLIELAAQGPITLEAAKIAIKSVDIMATPEKFEAVQDDNLSAYNQDIFKQAFLELTTYPLFSPELTNELPSELIKNDDQYYWQECGSSLEIYDKSTKNCIATLPLIKDSEIVDCIISKDAQHILLLTFREKDKNCTLGTLCDTKTKKIAFVRLECAPGDYEEIYFDNKNHLIIENLSHSLLIFDIPLFYFDANNVALGTAINLYVYQTPNKKVSLNIQWCITSSFNKLQLCNNFTDDQIKTMIKNKIGGISQLNSVIERNNPEEIKIWIKLILTQFKTIENASRNMAMSIESAKKASSEEGINHLEAEYFKAESENFHCFLKLISTAQEQSLVAEAEQEMAQESEEEEENI